MFFKKKTSEVNSKSMFHVEHSPQSDPVEKNKDHIKKEYLTKILAVANQKGGVAKTTTAVNLSACLAASKRKVMLVDIDPQGNATSGLGIDRNALERCIYDLLVGGMSLQEVIVHTDYSGLDLLPATIGLAGAEIEMVPLPERELRLKKVLQQARGFYDYVFIDCPPSLGLLTLNALCAADKVLIPIQCEYYALEGLGQLLQTIKLLRKSLNPDLELEGVLLTMFNARTNLSIQVAEEVKDYFGDKVFKTIIPRNVRLSEAPSYGKPAISYDPRSKGALFYQELAEEVMAHEE